MNYFSAPGITDKTGYILKQLGLKETSTKPQPGRRKGVTGVEVLKRTAVAHFLQLKGDSYPTIASKLGYKNHTTPLQNIRSFRNMLAYNDPLALEIVNLIKPQLIKLGIIQ